MSFMISIIVPVFNSEKTLNRCIQSILAQDYQNFELILVNDGSTDASAKICTDFLQTDNRIVLVEQRNAGASAARNKGIIEAHGDYLMFVDSDDYIEPGAVSMMLDIAAREQVDWVVGCVQKHLGNDQSRFFLPDLVARTRRSLGKVFEEMEDVYSFYQPVAKIYKTSVIKENACFFRTDLQRGEDYEFNCRFALLVNSVCTTDTVVYHYVLNASESLSNRFYDNAWAQDAILFSSISNLHADNIQRAYDIQLQLGWERLTDIAKKCCSLSFSQKVQYISNYLNMPAFQKAVNESNSGIGATKLAIMRIKNPSTVTVIILILLKTVNTFRELARHAKAND